MLLKNEYQNFRTFLFDCDGVIWEEDHLLPGSKTLLEFLKNGSISYGFISNNSTKSLNDYLQKFSQLDIPINKNQIVTSTVATVEYLKQMNKAIENVFVIGEDGLSSTIKENGFNVITSEKQISKIDAVVVGMDRDFNYPKLKTALQACLNGAHFIGTNPDPQYPTKSGFAPGAGSMIGALARSLNQEPEIICGKPNPFLASIIFNQLNANPKTTVMIGDRVSTDLEFAVNVGIKPVLVKTGFGNTELKDYPDFPYYAILETLEDIFLDD